MYSLDITVRTPHNSWHSTKSMVRCRKCYAVIHKSLFTILYRMCVVCFLSFSDLTVFPPLIQSKYRFLRYRSFNFFIEHICTALLFWGAVLIDKKCSSEIFLQFRKFSIWNDLSKNKNGCNHRKNVKILKFIHHSDISKNCSSDSSVKPALTYTHYIAYNVHGLF